MLFENHDAIVVAVSSPKFKLRWVESQEKKDQYKQMLVDEMHLLNDDIQVEEFSSESQEKEKKKD